MYNLSVHIDGVAVKGAGLVTGKGTSLVFVHEFAGDYRSWEPQMRYFARR